MKEYKWLFNEKIINNELITMIDILHNTLDLNLLLQNDWNILSQDQKDKFSNNFNNFLYKINDVDISWVYQFFVYFENTY
jgi:hypothetical protein